MELVVGDGFGPPATTTRASRPAWWTTNPPVSARASTGTGLLAGAVESAHRELRGPVVDESADGELRAVAADAWRPSGALTV